MGVTRKLLAQAPDAVLIPERVEVDFALVDVAREFNLEGGGGDAADPTPKRDRLHRTTVFTLDRAHVAGWAALDGKRLPGAGVALPDTPEPRYQLMLLTRIQVYGDHRLEEYNSGLTCPRVLSLAQPLRAGDALAFHYELGRHPRLACAHHQAKKDPETGGFS